MDKSSEKISTMFDQISDKYEFLNIFFSMGIERLWRKKLVTLAKQNLHGSDQLLDIACGTGKITEEFVGATGIDFSQGMIKIAKLRDQQNHYIVGDALHMPFHNETFAVTTNAYGLRNFSNRADGLQENFRVLQHGGVALFLDFSYPKNKFIKYFYDIYLKYYIPFIARLFFKKEEGYKYLAESIDDFARNANIEEELRLAGFNKVRTIEMTFNIARIYLGYKNA